MPIWLKISFIVSSIFVLALWVILRSTNDVFYSDKRNFLVEMSSKINTSVGNVFVERILNTKNKLAIFVSNYESLSEDKKSHPDLDKVIFSQYPEFEAIALVDANSGASPLRWLRIRPDSLAKAWPDTFYQNLLSPYAVEEYEAGEVKVTPFEGPDLNKYFVVSYSAVVGEKSENVKILAVVGGEMFLDLLADYKASLNTVFVTNQKGMVVAHPFASEIGKDFNDYSVVTEVSENGRQQGVGDAYLDLEDQEIVASFQRIPNTNLYTFTTTPKGEAFAAANELWRTLLVIAFGVLLIGVVVSLLFTKIITNPLNRLKAIAQKIGSGTFNVEVDVNSKDEVGDLASSIRQMSKDLIEREEALENSKNALVQSEKMSAFGQLSAGIAHEVKNPLAGILGHAQLAKGKTKDGEVLKHVDFIEKETRRTKEIIENLMKFSRAEKLELEPTNLYDTVHGAVDLVDHQLSLQNVKIFRHINRCSAVLGQGNQIQQVLLNLMMNAGHAMEDRDTKELHVYLDDKEDVVQIRIRDTGCGMPQEVQDRIFEPFFTTKPAGKGTGLGLSVSVGIIKDHKANMYIESEENVGTTFFIDFPKALDVELPASQRAEGEVEKDMAMDKVAAIKPKKAKRPDKEEEAALAEDSDPEDIVVALPDTAEVREEPVSKPEDNQVSEQTEVSETKSSMHGSRDYLMTDEQKEQVNLARKKVKKASKLSTYTEGDFKVKIRKPKTGK
tara:strand:+ start:17069 stop:19249 length:2181 start_codon:yes stop_codon:yes gene_type:complete